jgi:hypothetical protein
VTTKNSPLILTGTNTAAPTQQEYPPAAEAVSVVAGGTGLLDSVIVVAGDCYSASISSDSTTVDVSFDPVLTERKQRTSTLNKAIKYGYVPPASSTKS